MLQIFCFLFFFCAVVNKFLKIPIVIENRKLKLTLVIPAGALITVANGTIEMLPLVADKKN